MNRFLTPICLYCLISSSVSAQSDSQANKSLTLNATYIGDFVRNFSGGIKKGSSYLGLANFKVSFDTKNASLWKGGQFFINAANAHGGNPSADFTGDFHTVTNIEADDITIIQELWYRQTINQIEVILGLQDLNTDFVSTEYGSLFINSTFGTPSTLADNLPSPIFPLTTMGVSFKWNISDENIFKLALFDGLPTELSRNPHNLNWKLNKDDGVFGVTEFHHNSLLMTKLSGSYRAGAYYHSQLVEYDDESIETKRFDNNYGVYFIADQKIYQPGSSGGLGMFAQIALSPKAINTHHRYIGLGLSWQGIFRGREEDNFGIAVSNAAFNGPLKRDETVIELCYKAQLTENLFIQPDLQYVINPEGTDVSLRNATVGFIRFGLNFN